MLRPSLGFETGVFTSDSRNGLTTPFVLGTRALELSAVERVKKVTRVVPILMLSMRRFRCGEIDPTSAGHSDDDRINR